MIKITTDVPCIHTQQKATMKWLQLEDGNSVYFHQVLKAR